MAARVLAERRIASAGAAALWAASLCLPALRVGEQAWPGWALLLWGVLGVLDGYIEWLGNPALIAAQAVFWLDEPREWRVSVLVALLVLALVAAARQAIPTDESGVPRAIEAHLPGFVLWLAAMLLSAATLLPPTNRRPA